MFVLLSDVEPAFGGVFLGSSSCWLSMFQGMDCGSCTLPTDRY